MNFLKSNWGKAALIFGAGWLFSALVTTDYVVVQVKKLTGKAS